MYESSILLFEDPIPSPSLPSPFLPLSCNFAWNHLVFLLSMHRLLTCKYSLWLPSPTYAFCFGGPTENRKFLGSWQVKSSSDQRLTVFQHR